MHAFRLAILLCLVITSSAQAKWFEVSSDHFLVYANQKEKTVLAYADRLERFHDAMRMFFNREPTLPSPSNRVTIFIVNTNTMRKLHGGNNKHVKGFYIPRAGGSVAFSLPLKESTQYVLLHEYAHHYMYDTSNWSYPSWLVEGFAEFFAGTTFEKNGVVGLGVPAYHRKSELTFAKQVPIEWLLNSSAYYKNKSKSYDTFYGRSWLLFHMLQFSGSRDGQLTEYLKSLATGNSEIDAARIAFGDLAILNNDLDQYQKQRQMNYLPIAAELISTGPIKVRQLRPGEAAMMPIFMRAKRGVSKLQAKENLPKALKIASKYSNDPAVMATLAEAEFDAGNDNEAISAAERAIALDSKQMNAHIQKGYALANSAKNASDKATAWDNVREHFVKANQIENDHPVPLIYNYLSFREQGTRPSKNSVAGLFRALEVAPFAHELRLMLANQQLEDRQYSLATTLLKPVAHSPHQSKISRQAHKMLKKINAMSESQSQAKPGI